MFLLVNVASMDGCSIGSRVKGEMLMADVPQAGAVGGRLTADAPQGAGGKGRCSSWMFHAELGERADSHCRCFPASWEKGELLMADASQGFIPWEKEEMLILDPKL